MNKKVQYLLPSETINMGGIFVQQALPTHKVRQVDPFLLLHHGHFKFRSDALAKHQGIGPHPHRGFSPVTFVIEGEVHHQDSRGNNQIAIAGEVQWMHAGAGIIHSERPSQELVERNGKQEIIQLWINTPANKKLQPPNYQYCPQQKMPSWTAETSLTNKLVAGNYNTKKGPVQTESALIILWCLGAVGTSDTYTIPAAMNTMGYVIKGQISISGYGTVDKEALVVLEQDNQEGELNIKALDDCQFLILAGVPLNEKLVQQGPFVMNTETEILEAMRDYQMGKMGILIED